MGCGASTGRERKYKNKSNAKPLNGDAEAVEVEDEDDESSAVQVEPSTKGEVNAYRKRILARTQKAEIDDAGFPSKSLSTIQLVSYLPLPAVAWSEDGMILHCNASLRTALGYGPTEIVNSVRTLMELPEELKKRGNLGDYFRQMEHTWGEVSLHRGDGDEQSARIFVIPLTHHGDESSTFVALFNCGDKETLMTRSIAATWTLTSKGLERTTSLRDNEPPETPLTPLVIRSANLSSDNPFAVDNAFGPSSLPEGMLTPPVLSPPGSPSGPNPARVGPRPRLGDMVLCVEMPTGTIVGFNRPLQRAVGGAACAVPLDRVLYRNIEEFTPSDAKAMDTVLRRGERPISDTDMPTLSLTFDGTTHAFEVVSIAEAHPKTMSAAGGTLLVLRLDYAGSAARRRRARPKLSFRAEQGVPVDVLEKLPREDTPALLITQTGTIGGVNAAALKVLDYDSDSCLIGQDIAILMPPRFRDVHAGYFNEVMKRGRPSFFGIPRRVQFSTRCEDYFNTQIVLTLQYSAMTGEDYIVCVFEEVLPGYKRFMDAPVSPRTTGQSTLIEMVPLPSTLVVDPGETTPGEAPLSVPDATSSVVLK